MSDRWDLHFLNLCLAHARMSKDPSTKVGALIVGPDREIRSVGFNGFPRGILDSPERWNDRDLKHALVVHAELNAILAAARIGVSIKGCTLYVALIDQGQIRGSMPCLRCLVEIIQAGISEIVSLTSTYTTARWAENFKYPDLSKAIIEEANVSYREVKA